MFKQQTLLLNVKQETDYCLGGKEGTKDTPLCISGAEAEQVN